MTSLLAQFVAEARDLLDQANAGLLALERRTGDADLLNTVFRAVHTLKGSSGLFEIAPLTQVVHAGEDLLGAVRAERFPLEAEMVDLLLAGLDQVGTWIGALESGGLLPEDAEAAAQDLIGRLRRWLGSEGNGAGGPATADGGMAAADLPWLAGLPEADRITAVRHALATGAPLAAILYQPDPQCFFQGEDPLHLVRQVPDLRALRIAPAAVWPPLAELDPFVCALRFEVLAAAPVAVLHELFRYVPGQAAIAAVPPQHLILPVGDPLQSPVYEDFCVEAGRLLTVGDRDGLRRAVATLLDLSGAGLRHASALRWLLVLLDAPGAVDPAWLGTLLDSMRTGEPPRWTAAITAPPGAAGVPPAAAPAPVPGLAGLAEADAAALRDVLAGQRHLLGPCPEEEWLGRVESAARTIRNSLTFAGRSAAVPDFDAALERALAERTAAPLLDWLDGRDRLLAGSPAALPPTVTAAAAPVPAAAAAAATAAARPTGGTAPSESGAVPKTLRVDQAKVDALMTMVGELIVAKNSLPYLARRAETAFNCRELGREIKEQYAVINRIAQDLQGAMMAVRMLPVSQVFQRFPRLVRDLSRKLDKRIDLVIEGGETEADKNVIETLTDPLIHMLRNSIDHGIEAPEDRVAAGKPEHGTIRLVARQENDSVVIELSDDGGGIDPERIKRKAFDQHLIDAARRDSLSDEEAIQLIFAPGFSTAAQVSDVSGRGVGMDVVRTAVEKVGGRVILTSRKGVGTTVRLSLPLTMVVTRVMTITSGGRLFGVPMDLIVETVRVPRRALHAIKDREVFVLRNSIVPICRLARLLDLPAASAAGNGAGTAAEDGDEVVLVVRLNGERNGGERIGLIVDQFREGMEVIVKPLEGILHGLRGFSGTALLGDGHVLLILDLRELI